ncbi:MAG: hypothetical protein GX080_07010 [Tissierellia bacterium]|nr:hypothetical protein [Tissierellia bacterium]
MTYKKKLIVANTRDDSLAFVDSWIDGEMEIVQIKDSDNYDQKNLMVKFHSYHIGPYDLSTDGKNYLYCANIYDNSVMKIDLVTRKIIDLVPVGKHPSCIRYFNNHLYIANGDSNSISVVEEESFSLIENIPVGEKPIDMQIDEDNNKLYVANGNGLSIDVIDLKEEKRNTIKLQDNPVKLLIDDERMYILSNVNNGLLNNSNVYIMDLKAYRIKPISNLKGIFNSMIQIYGSEVIFITNIDNGYLYRMDIKKGKLLSKTYIGGMPNRLEWDGDKILYISNILTNHITVFDISLNKPIYNIRVGREPNGIILVD